MRKTIVIGLLAAIGSCAQPLAQRPGSKSASELQTLLDFERARLQAFGSNDKAAFAAMVADDLVMTHSNGEVLGKAEEIRLMRPSTPESPLPRLGIDGVQAHFYGAVAVMAGSLIETSNGRKVLGLRFTNTYIRNGRRWQMVAGQLTKVASQ